MSLEEKVKAFYVVFNVSADVVSILVKKKVSNTFRVSKSLDLVQTK